MCRAKFQEEVKQLEKAREDLQLEQTFLLDKFRQLRAENDRLKAEVDAYKGRLNHATQDYVRIRTISKLLADAVEALSPPPL